MNIVVQFFLTVNLKCDFRQPLNQVDSVDLHSNNLVHQNTGDASHTGQIGTALYVAPELNTCSLKATYNQVSFV